MAPSAISPPERLEKREPRAEKSSNHIVRTIIIVAAAVLCVSALVLGGLWPFKQSAVLQDLREASDSQVQVRAFHRTYFPSPGCVIERLVFHHSSNEAKPLITIEKLTVQGSYLGMLSRRVSRITGDGMLISIPAFGTGQAFHTTPSKITIDEIVANGAAIEFASHDPGKSPLRFDVHEASLQNVGWSGPLTYRVKVHNPEPPGEVTTTGKFGVWNKTDAGETPVSGEYTFEQADLGVYEGIAGKLASTGQFGGKLSHIDISGTIDVPDFDVKSGGHPTHLTTKFSAFVDGTNGDTFLKQVDSDFWKTHVVSQGSVAGSSGEKGKTALINLRATNARIEDLLRLFVDASRAPMSGSVSLQADVEIPPGPQEFLRKVKLRGHFGIASGTFSTPSTQEGVNKLSAGALGEKDKADPETVLTDLTGSVNLAEGIAHFSDLAFGVPGASARLHGTYNLVNHKIDLRGQMKVESKISNTESGAKAALLKMMEPFFKKKKKGEIVPGRISGTYAHPLFGLDLNDKHAQSVPAPRFSTFKNSNQHTASKPNQ